MVFSVRGNIAANYAGQAWTAIMSLAFVPVYIRHLGMEAYGLIGVFAMLQVWLSLLDLGLTPTLGREMARPLEHRADVERLWSLLRSVEVAVAGIGAATAIALAAASGWLASAWLTVEALPLRSVASACALMGVVTGLRFLENAYRSSVAGLQRQVSLNVATGLLATIRSAGAAAIVVWVSRDIQTFFLWQVLVSLLSVVVLRALVVHSMPPSEGSPKFGWASLAGVGRFSAGTFGISLLGFMISQTDKLVLSKVLPLSAFGTYSLAAALAAYVRLFAASIDQAVFPRLVALHESGREDELARFYHRATQLSVVLMGGIGAGLGIFGDHFLLAWTRDPDLTAAAYPLLWLLLLGMVANGLLNGPYYLQMAAGWTSMLLKTNIVVALVFVPALIWVASAHGGIGAAAAWAAVNLVYLIVVVTLMHRRLLPREKWQWYLRDVGRPLGAALLCGLLLKGVLPPPRTPGMSALLAVTGCLVTLAAAALAADHTRHAATSLVFRRTRHA